MRWRHSRKNRDFREASDVIVERLLMSKYREKGRHSGEVSDVIVERIVTSSREDSDVIERE